MSAGVFILILVVAIAALVLMIVKAKMHPVLALFIAALGTGIALGYGVTGSVDYISNGFGGTLGSVGITIILGAIISMAIEDTGARPRSLQTSLSSCSVVSVWSWLRP